MPDLRMRAYQMRFYDRICKFKIATFVLHIYTSDGCIKDIEDEKMLKNKTT